MLWTRLKRTKRHYWNLFKVFLALSLLGIVLSQVSLIDVKIMVHQISYFWILGALISFVIGYFVLATRYWRLFEKEFLYRDILNLVTVQAVIGNLIASVAGVLSYVGILRSKHNVPITRSVAIFILVKFSDLFAFYLGLLISSYLIWQDITKLHNYLLVMLSLITLGLVFFIIILTFRRKFAKILRTEIGKYNLNRFHFIDINNNFIQWIALITNKKILKILFSVLGFAIVFYITQFLFIFCVIRSFSIYLGIWEILFILSITQIIFLIPIQVFSGLGVIDLTTLYLYIFFGLSESRAASVVLGFRILLYLLNLFLIFYLLADLRGNFMKDFASQKQSQKIFADNQK